MLEEDILAGRLMPGQRLDEQELAARFEVSRTPVREALLQLASSGLVEMRARQGAVVAELTIPRLVEMFQVMAELEGLCARLAVRRMSPSQLDRVESSQEEMRRFSEQREPFEFYEANKRFHEAVYEASQNAFLWEQTQAIRGRVAPYRRYVTLQPGRMQESIVEHDVVIQAIRDGDEAAAHDAMRDHVLLLSTNFSDFIAALPAALRTVGARQHAG